MMIRVHILCLLTAPSPPPSLSLWLMLIRSYNVLPRLSFLAAEHILAVRDSAWGITGRRVLTSASVLGFPPPNAQVVSEHPNEFVFISVTRWLNHGEGMPGTSLPGAMHLRSGWRCLGDGSIVLPEVSYSTLSQSGLPAFSLGFFIFLSGFLEEESLGASSCVHRVLHLSLLNSWHGYFMSGWANDSACHPFTPCANSRGLLILGTISK